MNRKTVFKLSSIRYPALRVTRAKIFAEKTNLFRIGTPPNFFRLFVSRLRGRRSSNGRITRILRFDGIILSVFVLKRKLDDISRIFSLALLNLIFFPLIDTCRTKDL